MQQQKQKKIPVRRCVGCNAQRPKRELVRVVRSPEGEISIHSKILFSTGGKKSARQGTRAGRVPLPQRGVSGKGAQGKTAGAHL